MVSFCLIVDLCPFSELFFWSFFLKFPYLMFDQANFHKKAVFYKLGLTNHHPDYHYYNWLVLV